MFDLVCNYLVGFGCSLAGGRIMHGLISWWLKTPPNSWENPLALTLTVRTPQCGNTCFGELPKRIDYTGLTLLWLSCSLQEPTKRKNAQYRFSFFCCYSLKFSWPYWQKCSVHLVVVVFTCLHIKNVFRILIRWLSLASKRERGEDSWWRLTISFVVGCVAAGLEISKPLWFWLRFSERKRKTWDKTRQWYLSISAFQRGNGKLEIRPDSGTYRLALFREETENLR